MSTSTHIKAFIPDTDLEFQRHKKVFLVCLQAKVSLPHETADYFNFYDGIPDNGDLLDSKLEIDIKNSNCLNKWHNHDADGYEIDLTKLPQGVTKIRFYNSW